LPKTQSVNVLLKLGLLPLRQLPLQKPPGRCGDREQAYRMSNTELSIRCELIGYRGMLQMRSSE
jgi:hypothetical protein